MMEFPITTLLSKDPAEKFLGMTQEEVAETISKEGQEASRHVSKGEVTGKSSISEMQIRL